MKISFASLGCPAWSIERIATEATRMGYDGVELRVAADGNHLPPDASPDSCGAIRSIFEKQKIVIACLMGYTNFATPDEALRSKSVQTCESLIQTAAQLECPTVRIFGGDAKENKQAEIRDRVVRSLEKLLPRAERSGVHLAFETHDAWCDPSELMTVMNRLPSKHLGVCWDIANTSRRLPHEQTWQALKSRVIHVHAKDITPEPGGITLPGLGAAHLSEAIRMLVVDRYEGWVSFEWEKKWHATIPEPEAAFPHFIDFVRRTTSPAQAKLA